MWPLDTKQRVREIVKQFCKDNSIDSYVSKNIRNAVSADLVFTLSVEEVLVLVDAVSSGDFLEKDNFGFAFYEYAYALLMMDKEHIKERTNKVVSIKSRKPKAKVLPFQRRT